MKIFSSALLCATMLSSISALSQDHVAMTASESACGPKETAFTVNTNGADHPTPSPDPDKALVFVIEDLGQCVECDSTSSPFRTANVNQAIVKVGADGSWIGAEKGNSYLFFSISPGEHHLCVNWQSRVAERAHAFALSSLNAEAGKIYYYRARLFPGRDDFSFDLDLLNADEGKFLVASSAFSNSRAKK